MPTRTTRLSLIALTVGLAVLAVAPGAGAQVLGRFTPTGSMSEERASATATRLADGRVLVAGGSSATGDGPATPLASAEIYNPATGRFTRTGSMTTVRWYASAALLPNGKVLIAGGDSSTAALATAEIYDPATGKFTATGSMSQARSTATATLLANGTVLVAGGMGGLTAPTTAEIYDPTAGTFSPTAGNMTTPRVYSTATLLEDGQVLMAGSQNSPATELYNPTRSTFTAVGDMASPHSAAAAVRLANGHVLIAAGATSNSVLSSAEIYTPSLEGFTLTTGSLGKARDFPVAALLPSGKVLVAGGWGGSRPLANAEVFDPATNRFAATGSLDIGRMNATATLLENGKVLVAGGWSGSKRVTRGLLYDPNKPALPMKPGVRWSVSGGLVKATFRGEAGATYRLTARQGRTLKTSNCSATSMGVICPTAPGRGRWTFSVIPRNVDGNGPANTKVLTLSGRR